MAFARHKSALRVAVSGDRRLTPSARRLATIILERIYCEGGYCAVSFPELQRAIGVSCRRTVQRAAAELERMGYFDVERSTGGQTTNRFRMPLVIPDPGQNVTGDTGQNVTGDTGQGVTLAKG